MDALLLAAAYTCVVHLLFCEVSLRRLVFLGLCPWTINLHGVLTNRVVKGFVMLLRCISINWGSESHVNCLSSRSGRQVLQTSILMTSRMNSTLIHFRCSFFILPDRPTDSPSQETGRWETKHFIGMTLLRSDSFFLTVSQCA